MNAHYAKFQDFLRTREFLSSARSGIDTKEQAEALFQAYRRTRPESEPMTTSRSDFAQFLERLRAKRETLRKAYGATGSNTFRWDSGSNDRTRTYNVPPRPMKPILATTMATVTDSKGHEHAIKVEVF